MLYDIKVYLKSYKTNLLPVVCSDFQLLTIDNRDIHRSVISIVVRLQGPSISDYKLGYIDKQITKTHLLTFQNYFYRLVQDSETSKEKGKISFDYHVQSASNSSERLKQIGIGIYNAITQKHMNKNSMHMHS